MTTASFYPIVLAHGICRFDQLLNKTFGLDNAEDDGLHYFRGIRSALRQNGIEAYHSKVSWAAGVETRADELREQILKLTNGFQLTPKVHIIAHSMGGLDARHMIFRHRMEDRVASLSTIGTPHWGSSFADWGLDRAGAVLPILKQLGLDADGFADLTTKKCAEFNAKAESFERNNGVQYKTYAGTQKREHVFWPLQMPFGIIYDVEKENDGLVSLNSAKWREDLFVEKINADHLNEVGWWDPNEPGFLGWGRRKFEQGIRDFYVRMAKNLPKA